MFQTGNFLVRRVFPTMVTLVGIIIVDYPTLLISVFGFPFFVPLQNQKENIREICQVTESSMAQSWQSCDDERSLVRLRDSRSVAAGGCGRAQHSWSLIFG